MSAAAAEVCALVLAAGQGLRLGDRPKALLTLDGRSLVARAVDHARRSAGEIVVAVRPGDVAAVAAALGDPAVAVIAGGARRHDSFVALLAASRAPLILLLEAARPLTAAADVAAVLAAARTHGAATLFQPIPPRDSLALRHGDTLAAPLARDAAVWLQTPQAFRRDWIADAVAAVPADAEPTSTVFLLSAHGRTVHLVPATTPNLKITYPGDLAAAEASLRTSS